MIFYVVSCYGWGKFLGDWNPYGWQLIMMLHFKVTVGGFVTFKFLNGEQSYHFSHFSLKKKKKKKA